MRVRISPWDGQVEGLGAGRELPLLDGKVGQWVQDAVARAGASITQDAERCLVIPDGSLVGPDALRALHAAVVDPDRDARLVLGGRTGELVAQAALGVEPPPMGWLGSGQGDPTARLLAAPVIAVDPDERVLEGALLPGGAGIPLSDRVVLPVRHQVGLLWASLLGLGPRLWGLLVGRGALSWTRLVWGALRAASVDPLRVAGTLSQGGWVHPSATVEASWLGEGCRVDAGAVVRGCILGAGSRVEPLAHVEGCVLGQGVVVQRQALSKFSVLADRAVLGGVVQLAVLGPDSALKLGSYAMDQGLTAAVRVPRGGELVPAPTGMHGVCLGPGAQVGSGVWVAPGRVIPAGVTVLGASALSRTDVEPGTYLVRDGRLVQIRRPT